MSETITSTSGNITLTLPDHVNAHLQYFDELRTSMVDLLDKIEAAAGGGGILNRDSETGVISADTATDTLDIVGVTTDTIDESTSAAGVTIDGVLAKDGGLKLSAAINIAEITTPTAVPDYCALYTKSDNKLYFQDGAGTEHEVTLTA